MSFSLHMYKEASRLSLRTIAPRLTSSFRTQEAAADYWSILSPVKTVLKHSS